MVFRCHNMAEGTLNAPCGEWITASSYLGCHQLARIRSYRRDLDGIPVEVSGNAGSLPRYSR